MHTFKMTEAQAEAIFATVEQHIGALKNWTVSAVERGDLEGAQKLAKEVREYRAIFAGFNMPAKRTIAEATGKPLETATTLRSGDSL